MSENFYIPEWLPLAVAILGGAVSSWSLVSLAFARGKKLTKEREIELRIQVFKEGLQSLADEVHSIREEQQKAEAQEMTEESRASLSRSILKLKQIEEGHKEALSKLEDARRISDSTRLKQTYDTMKFTGDLILNMARDMKRIAGDDRR